MTKVTFEKDEEKGVYTFIEERDNCTNHYTVLLDAWEMIAEYCDGTKEKFTFDDEGAINLLIRLAKDEGSLESALLAMAIEPSADSEFFLDIRYILNSKGELIALELLPCYGSPGCRWVRIDRGSSKLADAVIDAYSELVPRP